MPDPGAELIRCNLPERAAKEGFIPPGVHLVTTERQRWPLIPDVEIRCRSQSPEAPPLFSRPRFAWNRSEVAGALGDLGTFLPHVLGAIAVVGMAPTGVLTGFGLLYLASGLIYGIPIGVQPMKAASAAVLIQHMTPAEVAGAGLVIGAFFTLAGLTGAITWLARITPTVVVAGIQLGLGLALALLGVRLVEQQWLIGLATGVVIFLFLGSRRVPAAIVGLTFALVMAYLLRTLSPVPAVELGLHLPSLVVPAWADVFRGTQIAVLPQIPLTLTNAIIVTSALAYEKFPKEQHGATVRRLSLTTGLGNLLVAPFGGYMMCHGAGGLAGHYRFGARTATATLLIGSTFLVLGIGLGDSAIGLLRLIPEAALGALLFFSGLELAASARIERYGAESGALMTVLIVATVAVATNAALAFAVGLLVAYGTQRRWLRL